MSTRDSMEKPGHTLEEAGVLSSDFSSSRVCTKDDTAFSLDDVQLLIVLWKQTVFKRCTILSYLVMLSQRDREYLHSIPTEIA
jgi:hypothetical protein